MKKRANPGDVFSVQLPNGQYMFGRVLLDIKQQCFKSGILEMATSQLRYGSISYLIEIYDCINETGTLNSDVKVVIPGIVVDGGSFEDDTWRIIDNTPIDVSKLDFEEDIRFYSGKILLTRGELMFSKNTDDVRFKKFLGCGKGNSRNIFDRTLALLGRSDLALRKADIRDCDTRFADPELRKLVYDILEEDINMSYYDMALKHGFDTARFFKSDKTKSK